MSALTDKTTPCGEVSDTDFVAPASFAQEQLWLLERAGPRLATYTLPLAWKIAGKLDPVALGAAVDDLVARHEALRTRLCLEGDQLVQRVAMRTCGVLDVVDAAPAADSDNSIDEVVRRNAQHVFDLEQGTMFVARVHRYGPELHLLTLAFHHAVADDESLPIIADDLWACYRFRTGEGSKMPPPLALQYADYAAWERHRLSTERRESALGYWQNRLAGAPTRLDLPGRAPTSSGGSQAGWVPLELKLDDTAWLHALAERNRASLFMVCAAIYQVLLFRSTGLSDFLIGYPSSVRNRSELAGVVGMFVTMRPLRCKIGGSEDLAGLIRAVRDQVLHAEEQGDLPFEAIVERLRPERLASRNPLFQLALSVASAKYNFDPGGDLRIEAVAAPPTGSKFDLTLHLTQLEDRIIGGFEFDAAQLHRATVERLAVRAKRLIAHFRAHEGIRVDEASVLGPEELGQIAPSGPPLAAQFVSIAQSIVDLAREAPDAIALIDGEVRLTRERLQRRAQGIAGALVECGAGPADPIGIVASSGVDWVAGALGALLAGSAYVLLDPALPSKRLRGLANGLGIVRFLVGTDSAVDWFGAGDEVVSLDACGESQWRPAAPVNAMQPACFIHTSGSTGSHKPIAITHAGLQALALWHSQTYGMDAGTVVSQVASPMFDAWGWEVWACLAGGGTLAIMPQLARGDPAVLHDALSRCGVQQAFLPTPLAEQYLAYAALHGLPPGLRHILTGGDRMTVRPATELAVQVHNHYGPAETTVVATAGVVTPAGDSLPHIGKGVQHAIVRVLDPRGRPAPIGVPGEICIGGVGVGLGYWGRPRETANAYVPDAEAKMPGQRLYRTGDIARWREDGALDFLGRADAQFKRNGVRIEPGEIEAALLSASGVRAAGVVLQVDVSDAQPRLVALFAGDSSPEDLRSHLLELLPRSLVPDTIVRVEKVPLMQSGKIDRAALLELAREDLVMAAAQGRLTTPLMHQIAAVWRALLGIDQLGPNDDFFALGGHSMLLIQLAARLRDELGIEVDVGRLFEAPRLRQQHDFLADLLAVIQPRAEVPDEPGFEGGVL